MIEQKPSSSYHHGNLRLALIEAALEQIKNKGVEALSLRGLARTLNVSQTAPYRHFKDKNSLLVEIASQAFDELYHVCSTTLSQLPHNLQHSQPTTNIIYHIGMTYLDYAINNPEKYKLMFGPSVQNRRNYEHLIHAGGRSFQVLLDQVELGIRKGEFIDREPLILAHTLWTQVHGSASLVLDGFYHNRPLPIPFDDFIEQQILIGIRSVQKIRTHTINDRNE